MMELCKKYRETMYLLPGTEVIIAEAEDIRLPWSYPGEMKALFGKPATVVSVCSVCMVRRAIKYDPTAYKVKYRLDISGKWLWDRKLLRTP